MTTLVLPYPISTNALFKNVRGKGRVKSDAYRAWLLEAGYTLNRQKFEPVAGPVRLSVLIQDKGNLDCDNALKAPIDLLVDRGIIEDDRRPYVRSIFVAWSDDVKGMQVTISPVEERDAA